MDFTHVYLPRTGSIIEIGKAKDQVRRDRDFYPIHDINRFSLDRHGRPSTATGGWSYGHIRRGWACAGAGGLNSLPLFSLI